MRNPFITTTAALLLAIAATPAFAADADMPAKATTPFDGMDTNGDGFMSHDEYEAWRLKHMEQRAQEREERREMLKQKYGSNMDESSKYSDIDTDQDGRVSHEEFEAYRQQRMEQRAQEREEREQQNMEKRQEMMEKHQKMMEEHQQMMEQHPEPVMPPSPPVMGDGM